MLVISEAFSQYAQLYPTNWFTGMKWNKVQLIVRGDYNGFSKEKVSIQYPGVQAGQVHQFENGKYMAIDLVITPAAKPGNVSIEFANGTKKHSVLWPLKPRREGRGKTFAQGVTSSDFIYFLMPDRFSNGDVSNDRIAGMRDQSLNRDSIFLRHGGDLQGVIDHLDYLQDMGVTTLWMTPVLENDMPNRTEHGYAFTDHYTIEPRFGGAEAYKKLSNALHNRGMKLIQDAVYNHVGRYHFLVQDAPAKNWLHQWPHFTQTSYREQPLFDPYASKADARKTADGWFTTEMPDLNQGNPYVANFLIQHAIWCVEEFGVDGWRIDTYIYNDLPFMNRCNKALTDEYPRMTMFGETWVHGVINQAYFAENKLDVPFKSNLQGVIDFQTLFYGIQPALNQPFGWTEGVNRLYTTLSKDIIYKDPMRNVIFLDNHDMTRFFTTVKEDVEKDKMGLAWLFTCRGIPQLYYGTEVLMKGESNPDGWVRLDFPGGWKGDKKNAFTGEGLTAAEKEIQQYTRTLANYRKHSTALQTGKLMQYVPSDGVYVYFRYDTAHTVMCIMNPSDKDTIIQFDSFKERTKGFTRGKEVTSGELVRDRFSIPAKKLWVIELIK
ncbi:MAG: glycoside hydrolase family 13 protein [Sediminibacterium sp.]